MIGIILYLKAATEQWFVPVRVGHGSSCVLLGEDGFNPKNRLRVRLLDMIRYNSAKSLVIVIEV
jgi:hypothetical protein